MNLGAIDAADLVNVHLGNKSQENLYIFDRPSSIYNYYIPRDQHVDNIF